MMTCTEIRARLPALLYGDLPADEAAALEKHLAGCRACRQERMALARARALLGAAPEPSEVQIDLPRLYGEAARRRLARTRRWRRAAALTGMAAVVLLGVLLKLEVRVEGHQVVLRWGAPPEAPTPMPPPEPAPPRPEPAGPQVTAAELQLVRELVHALAADIDSRDQQQRRALVWLRGRLDDLQRQAQERWHATEQLVAALHTVQMEGLTKGENP
jgi:hypothetical protein